MLCKKCGAKIEDGSLFCQSCGVEIKQLKTGMNKEKKVEKGKKVGIVAVIAVAIVICAVCLSNRGDYKNLNQKASQETKNISSGQKSNQTQTMVSETTENVTNQKAESEKNVTDKGTPEGIYTSEDAPASFMTMLSYVNCILPGNVEGMWELIAEEEREFISQYYPDAVSSFLNFYMNIYEQQKVLGEGKIPAANFERCYVFNWKSFLEYTGVTEDEIGVEYVKYYDKYHIFTGVSYFWIDAVTDYIDYQSLQPSDMIFIGEKNGEYEIIMALTEFI